MQVRPRAVHYPYQRPDTQLSPFSFIILVKYSPCCAGAQFVAATQESDFYVTAVLTLLVFGCSLAMAAASSRRPASRVWVVAGLAWVLCGYVIYLRKDFTEKPVEWLYIATVSSKIRASNEGSQRFHIHGEGPY